ncbi:MAG: tRNA adenosine(34) deaminase TadA [Pseudobdellovibrionaceae bacterium]
MEPQDIYWMQKALKLATTAADKGEVPVGSILISKQNKHLAEGHNLKEFLQSPLGHAEMLTLHRASQNLKQWRLLDCTLYVTLEPCLMCAGAILQSRISRVVFAASDQKSGACGSVYDVSNNSKLNHRFSVTAGVLASESIELLQTFFKKQRANKK